MADCQPKPNQRDENRRPACFSFRGQSIYTVWRGLAKTLLNENRRQACFSFRGQSIYTVWRGLGWHSATIQNRDTIVFFSCFIFGLHWPSMPMNFFHFFSGVHCAVARVGGGALLKLVGFNQATGLVSPLRRQIYPNPVWLGGLRSSASLRSPSDRSGSLRPQIPHAKLGLRCAHTRTVRARHALRAHTPNWIQTNLAPRGGTKPVGLNETCLQGVGAPPQTPG